MENFNQQISKKMFRTFFSIFLLLGIFFFIYSIYVLYDGLMNNVGGGFGLIGALLWLFIIFIAFIVFLVLIIKNAKSNRKETFIILSKVAIVCEIFVFTLPLYIAFINRSEISRQKAHEQEYALAENASTYQDCANMRSWIGKCADTVNEKTGDLQGCINLSIDYAKKGGICQAGGFLKDDPMCLVGFGCSQKNTRTFDGYKWNGSNLNSVWVGNADGTVTCKKEENLYCPPTEQ